MHFLAMLVSEARSEKRNKERCLGFGSANLDWKREGGRGSILFGVGLFKTNKIGKDGEYEIRSGVRIPVKDC